MASWWDGILAAMDGVQIIFKLGFVPKDEDLYELTPEQYERFYATAATEEDRVSKEKIYMVLPKDPKLYEPFSGNEVFVLREREVLALEAGERTIENYCTGSGKTFNSFDEKLQYCALFMPGVLSKGTKYEHYHTRTDV